MQKFAEAADYDKYLKRLKAFPAQVGTRTLSISKSPLPLSLFSLRFSLRQVTQVIELLKQGIAERRVLPRVSVEPVVAQLQEHVHSLAHDATKTCVAHTEH